MKITLLTVGKTDVKWVKEGLDTYASRLVHYAPFKVQEIPELKNVSALDRAQIKTREGEERTRVRAGPFTSREEADKAAATLKSLGLPSAVQTL